MRFHESFASLEYTGSGVEASSPACAGLGALSCATTNDPRSVASKTNVAACQISIGRGPIPQLRHSSMPAPVDLPVFYHCSVPKSRLPQSDAAILKYNLRSPQSRALELARRTTRTTAGHAGT